MKRKLSRTDIGQLHALGAMRERGILTQDEFADQKSLLLNLGGGVERAASRRFTPWIAAAVALLLLGSAVVGMTSSKSTAYAHANPAATATG